MEEVKAHIKKGQLDVVLIDEGGHLEPQVPLEELFGDLRARFRPKVIAVAGPTNWITNPKCQWIRKGRRKTLERMGYQCLEWFLESHHLGAALEQEGGALPPAAQDAEETDGRGAEGHPVPPRLPHRVQTRRASHFLPSDHAMPEWRPRERSAW